MVFNGYKAQVQTNIFKNRHFDQLIKTWLEKYRNNDSYVRSICYVSFVLKKEA